ncbi:protein unc-13 homolog 4B isoform X1 [Anastrepha ludens]|uniref:protein unc-13 homolog 4B isoform X1 n=1 Tax=Anastrepha ludens TaxID=28586 RepID=UPI0023B0A352|nr:protein unc-13 homolog 4B isoform X1 [Anastrepha ludens]
MDEENMWKDMFEKLQVLKANPPTEHESRLQDADGGFFEKFGYLLRQKSHMEETNLKTSLAPFPEDCPNDTITVDNSYEPTEGACESVNLSPLVLEESSDIHDIESCKEKFIDEAIRMNVEDLYEEILFQICNHFGCETNDVCSENLMKFVQEVFKISDTKHDEIAKLAMQKEPPKLRLNVEVIKAENLLSKDANGFSDPFATLYLESNATHRYNSSVKHTTLNPIWEEHFSLPITDNPKDEVLIVEIWDFDAAETVKEKVNKLFDVKGVKGLSKLMKEIAQTASTGKHDNELIGRAAITLKSIPTSGLTVWYNLEKGSRTKSRGSVLVSMTLSAEKNKRVAIQEHRHLLNLLLVHELDASQVAEYWWNGKFNSNAELIRSQHAVQSGLTNFDCALSQWTVYSKIHENHKLSFTLFNNLLDIIIPILKVFQTDSENIKEFWEGAKRILPSCFSIVRKIRARNVSDKHIVSTLCEVLDIISKIKTLGDPVCEIFPQNVYGFISTTVQNTNNVDEVLIEVINTGTKEWLEYLIEGSKPTAGDESTDEENLQFLIKLIQMVRSDLQRAMEYFDKHFYHKLRINYSAVIFKYYDANIFDICKSNVEDVCSHIKRLEISEETFEYPRALNTTALNMGTTLFELYLVLKRFVTLGKSLCANDELALEKFFCWFMTGVTHWLDISIVKALSRIDKAIELDQLQAVDDAVKYSSSAVDTLAIFYQIKIFWQQLDWPDVEGSYTFVAKIIDDVCRCCVFYSKRMSRHVESQTIDTDLFIVSPEWCFAINNIDYIRQSLPTFIKELGTDDLIKKISDFRTNLDADRCASTIKCLIDNALDTQKNQILELIDIVARRMAPSIKRFLAEGAEVSHKDSNSMEKLMMYMESSLKTLYDTLNELNFARILDAIWNELSVVMYDLIQFNLDKRRPPSFFRNLKQTLSVMTSCFKIGNIVTSDIEVLQEVEKVLDLHAFETADLIHQYYIELLGHQKSISCSEFGQLTIKANFTETDLVIYILNGRNLVPMDPNGSCDSFVKIHFYPTSRFPNVPSYKTSVHHKTRFPLYDEIFTINLTEEQLSHHNSLILFSIKDRDLFGMSSQYIAECYITFADLMANENEQIHMELSRPQYMESETIRALEYRQGDKQARDFIKKLKNKM